MGAGICKFVFGDWQFPLNNNIVWTQSQGHYKTPLAAWAHNELHMYIWYLLAWSSLAFEALAPFLFMWKRTRIWTVLFGICFHFSIAILMKDLIYFSLQMVTAYIFFVPPPLLRKWWNRLPWNKEAN